MKYAIAFSLSTALLVNAGLLFADEQEIIKSIEVDFGDAPPSIVEVEVDSVDQTLNFEPTFSDGTNSFTVPDTTLGNLGFTANGANACALSIDSNYTDSNEKFIVVNNQDNSTDSITYDLTMQGLGLKGDTSTLKTTGAPDGVLSQPEVVNEFWEISLDSSADNICWIKLNNVQAVNFQNSAAGSGGIIPGEWGGTGVWSGEIFITMTAS